MQHSAVEFVMMMMMMNFIHVSMYLASDANWGHNEWFKMKDNRPKFVPRRSQVFGCTFLFAYNRLNIGNFS